MDYTSLKITADSLQSKAGLATPANQTEAGWWLQIATAAEAIAGASTTANPTVTGYMLRAAKALELKYGGSGAEENASYEGFLERIADAMELNTLLVGGGTLANRIRASSLALTIGATTLVAPPTISGEDIVNGTLWADDGLDSPATTYTRRWLSGPTDTPTTPISGQIAQSLTVPSIGGDYVRLEVTPANGQPVRYSNAIRIHYATMTAPILTRTSISGASPIGYTTVYDNTVFADDIERVQYSSTFEFTAGTILWDATRGLTEAMFAAPFTSNDSVNADPAWDNPPPAFVGTYYVRRFAQALSGIVTSLASNIESNVTLDPTVKIDATSAWRNVNSVPDKFTFSADLLSFTASNEPQLHAGRVNYARSGADITAELTLVSISATAGDAANGVVGIGFDDGTFDWSQSPSDNQLKQVGQAGWRGFIFYSTATGNMDGLKSDGTAGPSGPFNGNGLLVGDTFRIRYTKGTFTGGVPNNDGTATCRRFRAGVDTLVMTLTGVPSMASAKLIFTGNKGATGTIKVTGITPAIESGSVEYQTA